MFNRQKNKKAVFAIAVLISILISILMLFFFNINTVVYADGVLSDGTYDVTVATDMAMGDSAVQKNAVLEKQGERYYASITFDTSSMENVLLAIDGKTVGFTTTYSGNMTTFTYTFSEQTIKRKLPFSAYITAMKRQVEFNLNINTESAVKKSNDINQSERPAEYIPVFQTEAIGNYEMAQGSTFVIPAVIANLGNEECTVISEAYYINNGVEKTVEVINNKFVLENLGEYHLVYTASSDTYTTSKGKPTYAVLQIVIKSAAESSSSVKYVDNDNALNATTFVTSQLLTGGNVFQTASEKMSKIADRFQVFNISLINEDGTKASLEKEISLYIMADSTFDRTKANVYYMDENGSLTKLNAKNNGRYIEFETNKTGNFIVCVPGVEFVMPMWGYIIIFVGAMIIIAGAVALLIIYRKKKKQKNIVPAE